jgi:hypothetical protein
MIPLISKESQQIQLPGNSGPFTLIHPALTVTVETGVAVIAWTGTNPHDWTRDTLSFPVGVSSPADEFVSGMASASPASFWTPLKGEPVSPGTSYTIPVEVTGATDDGDGVSAGGQVTIVIPGTPAPPPLGCAVDAAVISHSSQAGQPTLQLSLAVFGVCTTLLRVSYTAYLVNSHGRLIVRPGGPTTTTEA